MYVFTFVYFTFLDNLYVPSIICKQLNAQTVPFPQGVYTTGRVVSLPRVFGYKVTPARRQFTTRALNDGVHGPLVH